MASEELLPGGFDSTRPVVRVGDTVRRPKNSTPLAVRHLLQFLEEVSFDGCPRYLGNDEQGREVFSFIEGQVPLAPYPDWAMTDEALISVGQLLSRFHQATASFDPGTAEWALDRADPVGGSVICHNDPFPVNVVFRDGRAVALIDFDTAAPGRPLWDVAIAIQIWAPLHAPHVRWYYPQELDGIARAGILARAYGIKPEEAPDLAEIIFAAREHIHTKVRAEIANGSPLWTGSWGDRVEEQATADAAWLGAMRDPLEDAIADWRS
jgi:hypothetical protein